MTTPHPLLAAIPDELLHRTPGPGDNVRARRLLAWLEHRAYRPTLAELDAERTRLGMTTPKEGPR